MKVADIISRVRNIAGDTSALQFSDASIITWINDAMRECASDNQLLQKVASQPAEIGRGDYSLPPDILKLHSVQFARQELNMMTLDQAQQHNLLNNEQGIPQYAWVWAGKLNLFPVPSTQDQIEVYYTREPVDVTGDQDTPEIPSQYHMRLVDYCLAQVAQQDDDLNRYQMKMNEFRTGVQNLKDLPEWEHDLYPSITTADRDMSFYDDRDYLWY